MVAALELGPTPLSEVLARVTEFVQMFMDEPATEAALLPERALIFAWLGRTAEARTDAAAAQALDRELGRRHADWYEVLVDGHIAWYDRDLAMAEACFRRADSMLLERGDHTSRGLSGPPLARVLLELRRDLDAREVVRDFSDVHYYPMSRIASRGIDAVTLARRHRSDEALRLSADAEALAATTAMPLDQGYVALHRAEILLLAGRVDDAGASAESARTLFERKEYAIGIRAAREFLASLH